MISRLTAVIAAALLAALSAFADASSGPRERLLLDLGWKFHLGNDWGDVNDLAKAGGNSGPAAKSFSDASWRPVDLPHDWAVELPFDRRADMGHGYKPVGPGFTTNDIAWYRRTFDLPDSDAGKRLWLEFDGVYRNCDVYVNGWRIGHHDSGYDGFRFDITDVANIGGKNIIAVKVDASAFEGWFYEGAGIYRHVWLEKTSPVAIAPGGLFVSSKFPNNIPKGAAEIVIQTKLLQTNSGPTGILISQQIFDPSGQLAGQDLASEKAPHTSDQTVRVHSPVLWSPESPRLYTLATTLLSAQDGHGFDVLDRLETKFGIRTVAFDSAKGFLLNGKPYPIQGTCNHQDMAGVGVALPDALQYFRIAKLKEMGCNAYRTSHNAPTPELLDACDRLGMLILDENRLVGSDAENLAELQNQIERDRNHPCVFAWSLGNEEWNVQGNHSGQNVIRTMQNLAHSLDPSRLCTAAVNGAYNDIGFMGVLDVKGFNYNLSSIDPFRSNHVSSPFIGTETASTVTTRGIYANDTDKGYVAAYDFITQTRSKALPNPVNWGETAEGWWSFYDDRPWLSGGFAWTGFDYRGEPTPYEWPCINSHFGIIDMCGFPKDNFYFYQSAWTTNPMVHLLPHWNWPGKEGQDIDVWCYSNCKEVELFLNGKSLGKQSVPKNYHLEWRVKYSPGTLTALGFNAQEDVAAETKVITTGAPAALQLTADHYSISADHEDVSAVTVAIADSQGRIVPTAGNKLRFSLTGPGKIIGVGNGDPSCHEPDVFIAEVEGTTMPLPDWRSKVLPNVRSANLPELSPTFDDSAWDKADIALDEGPLEPHQSAIYRTTFDLPSVVLSVDQIQIRFGKIDDLGFVYVNGHKVGESHDWQSEPIFDAKPYLVPGKNNVAVAIINRDGKGGLNKGADLYFQEKPKTPDWSRSAFNGLAQVLIQSTTSTGPIQLTASADGLTSANLTINAEPATPRPAVP